MKSIPQRTCMGCNSKKNKKDLIRIIKIQNEIVIDKTGKHEGRGAYLCNNSQCLDKAIKSKRIERALELKISEENYDNLKKIFNGGEFIG